MGTLKTPLVDYQTQSLHVTDEETPEKLCLDKLQMEKPDICRPNLKMEPNLSPTIQTQQPTASLPTPLS